MAEASEPVLQLHLEPRGPIEVAELTNLLGSLARQYEDFALAEPSFGRPSEARLLISSVSPGSIDIAFQVDWASAASLIVPAIDHVGHLVKFAEHIKRLVELFKGQKKLTEGISVKDCDDVVNIVKPTAEHGGSQSINVINVNGQSTAVLYINVQDARSTLEGASRCEPRATSRRERAYL